MNFNWGAFLGVVVGISWFAGLVVLGYKAMDTWDKSRVKCLAMWACEFVLFALPFGFIIPATKNNSVHQWDGGSGPNTKCVYETQTRTEMVGKVPVNHEYTVTVCRD